MRRRIFSFMAMTVMAQMAAVAQMVAVHSTNEVVPKAIKSNEVESMVFLKPDRLIDASNLAYVYKDNDRNRLVDMGGITPGIFWQDVTSSYYPYIGPSWRPATTEELLALRRACRVYAVRYGSCKGYLVAPNGNYLKLGFDDLVEFFNGSDKWSADQVKMYVYERFGLEMTSLNIDLSRSLANVRLNALRFDPSFAPDKARVVIGDKTFSILGIGDKERTEFELDIPTDELQKDRVLTATSYHTIAGLRHNGYSSRQFFIPGEQSVRVIEAEDRANIVWGPDSKGQEMYTKKCTYEPRVADSETDGEISGSGYAVFRPSDISAQPNAAIDLGLLYGEYDIYVVMMPASIIGPEVVAKPMQFRVNLFDINNVSAKKTLTFQNPNGEGMDFVSGQTNERETVFVGTHNFENFIAKTADGQFGKNILQIQTYVSSSQQKTFTRNLCVDCVILIPHKAEEQ